MPRTPRDPGVTLRRAELAVNPPVCVDESEPMVVMLSSEANTDRYLGKVNVGGRFVGFLPPRR